MPSSNLHLIGIILAAGRGRRMGGTKQLVTLHTPAGEKPLVAVGDPSVVRDLDTPEQLSE
jgi:CTP:molybdopterin cytidylyltransferase MocA